MNKMLIIMSGFSGVGKGSILNSLKQNYAVDIVKSVTTRQQRSADDYYEFVSVEEFEHRLTLGDFLESNKYTSGYYGTPLVAVQEILRCGNVALLEIDPNGYRQVVDGGIYSKDVICSIFIAAEAEDLLSRLTKRGTEKMPQIIKRLETAVVEANSISMYEHLIVNNDLVEAEQKLRKVLSGETVRDDFDVYTFQRKAAEIIKKLKAHSEGKAQ